MFPNKQIRIKKTYTKETLGKYFYPISREKKTL